MVPVLGVTFSKAIRFERLFLLHTAARTLATSFQLAAPNRTETFPWAQSEFCV